MRGYLNFSYYYDNDVLFIFKKVLNPIDIVLLSVQEGYSFGLLNV